ncbi:MAG: hypothetical protein OEQ18_06065 [Gammaproteobacteria bacterium]|nr:hypothetical protein [Gammaproteobacteria bacterium]
MDEVKSRDFERLTDILNEGRCVLVAGPEAVVDPADVALTDHITEGTSSP